MYGWFEPGGSVNKFFSNTKMQDVVLRTSSLSNNIVIGNSGGGNAGPAAIYVNANNVGVQRIPDARYSLDVAATMRAENLLTNNIEASTIRLGSNTLITDRGYIRNNLSVAKEFRKPSQLITGQVVRICVANMDNTLNLILEPSPALENLVDDTMVQINGINYMIVSAPSTNEFVLSNYFGDSIYPIPFSAGQAIDIQILLDVGGDHVARITTWFTITSSSVRNDTWMGNVTFTGDIDLVQGQYYSFGIQQKVHNLVKLTSLLVYEVSPSDAKLGTITLKTIDGAPFPMNWLIPTTPFEQSQDMSRVYVALVLLDLIYPPMFEDANAVLGTYSSPTMTAPVPNIDPTEGGYIMLKNMQANDCLNNQSQATNSIRSISMNGIVSYDLNYSYLTEDGLAVAQLSSKNAAYAFSIKGTASYSIVGVPIKIQQVIEVPSPPLSPPFYKYIVDDIRGLLFPTLPEYLDAYMYVCCMRGTFCKIMEVNPYGAYFVLDANIIGAQPDPSMIFYVVPFKQCTMIELGRKCHVEHSMAIGTKIFSETLTVKGDASFVKRILLNDGNIVNNSFPISYSSNIFTLGPCLSGTKNTVTLEQDTTVNGTITANEFIQYSDRKIKTRIVDADMNADMELLKKISIKNFEFKESRGKPQKGVIAQDIERLIPGIVSVKKGFIPSVCKTFITTTSGAVVVPPRSASRCEFKKGMRLQVKVGGKNKFLVITRIRRKKDSVFLCLSERFLPGTPVYIRGPYGRVKGINKDYLFMLLLNVTKRLLINRS